METHRARDLRQIAEATHECGDPGMQFDTTINRWHTCEHGAHQRVEPVLGIHVPGRFGLQPRSLNLMKFVRTGRAVRCRGLPLTPVDTMIGARRSSSITPATPTQKIGENSHDFRPLGLGFANLGALLMSMGVPYDSDHGRDFAGAHHGRDVRAGVSDQRAHRRSDGSVPGLRGERAAVPEVIRHAPRFGGPNQPAARCAASAVSGRAAVLGRCYESGSAARLPNAQATVIAPTGTIGFMMDCDTTGIEPDLALVKYKKLVGGGVIKIVNNTVPAGADQAGLHAGAGGADRQPHRFHRHDRGRAASEGPSIWRCSIAASARRTARARSTTWAT